MLKRRNSDSGRVIRLLQVLFAVALLVLLWRFVEGEQALSLLGAADPIWLVAAFLAITLQTILSAIRWRLTAGALGLSLSRGRALREYYLAQIVNQALPGGILGDAGRAVRSRAPAGLLVSGQAVILERAAGQLALFSVMLMALSVTLLFPVGVDWPGWLLLGVVFLVISFAALVIVLWFIARRSSGKTGRFLMSLQSSSRLAFLPTEVLWRQVSLSVLTAVCNVAGFTFAAWAIGFQLSLLIALALVPMVLLAMLLPLTVSGWGLREGAAVLLFPLVGATATEGLVSSVAFGLVCLVAALPGLVFTRGAKQPGPLLEKDAERAA